MSSSAEGPVVVVTGANEGIGHHLLTALVEDGYRVAGLDVNVDQLRPLGEANPDQVRYYECDVTVDGDVEAAIDGVLDEWGQVDVLVNNAAVLNFGFFEDQTDEDLRRTFEVNYFGYVRTTRAVLPHMRSRGEGIVHNVSSGVGLFGNPGLTGYASTKGAIEALTRSLRLELQRENVSVTVMHPRLAKTRQAAAMGFPESRMSDPAEVGRALADRIESTGPVIVVDWPTRVFFYLARAIPPLGRFAIRRGTERFLDEREGVAGGETEPGPAAGDGG